MGVNKLGITGIALSRILVKLSSFPVIYGYASQINFNTLHRPKTQTLTLSKGEQNIYDLALLVVDMQAGTLKNLPNPNQLIENLTKAITSLNLNKCRFPGQQEEWAA